MPDTEMPGPPPPPPPEEAPVITTGDLPNGALGVAYGQYIQVTSGTAPYTWAVSAGALPPGLTLVGVSGLLWGTPTACGSYTFFVTVTDAASLTASQSYTLVVPVVPVVANVSLPAGTVGVPYHAALSGQGGAAPYGFRLLSGGLPEGLVLAATGGITGTPLLAGNFPVTFQIYDSNSPQGLGQATYTLIVVSAALADPVTTMDACVLIASEDGALYAVVPGQRHDTDYAGNPVGFLQRWQGVPGPSGKLTQLQIGGGTVSAKGIGALNVVAIDDAGNPTPLSTERRPMLLNPQIETKRDFMAKGAPKSERFGIALDNGTVIDAYFEAHEAILWVRPFYGYRKG